MASHELIVLVFDFLIIIIWWGDVVYSTVITIGKKSSKILPPWTLDCRVPTCVGFTLRQRAPKAVDKKIADDHRRGPHMNMRFSILLYLYKYYYRCCCRNYYYQS